MQLGVWDFEKASLEKEFDRIWQKPVTGSDN